MKLPRRRDLHHPNHVFLYEHDVRELHNPDPADFMRLMYVTRFQIVLDTLRRSAQGPLILDVGCAQGNFALALAEQGYRVVAMDLRNSFLRYLLLKHERGDVRCVTASVADFPFKAASFDVVLLGEILEHVAYPEKLLSQAAGLLNPGGIMIATTPNGERWHVGLPTLSAAKDREILTSRQFQPDADGHLCLLTKRELSMLARDAGLRVVTHAFLQTPWVTGRLRFRHVGRFLPVKIRLLLDRLTLRIDWLSPFVSEGQLFIAQRERGR
jgi:2-polyprenyl-3-methyl-5-hydroxy-6-metoxy-1,4-benzoquinol methylase